MQFITPKAFTVSHVATPHLGLRRPTS